MNRTYAMVIAQLIAGALIVIATRRGYSWKWYACAAIILGACAYASLKPQDWFAEWGAW